MSPKVQMQSNNHQMIDEILKEQKKYRQIDQPKFPPVSPSVEIKEIPLWFFTMLIVSTPITIILMVALIVRLLHD